MPDYPIKTLFITVFVEWDAEQWMQIFILLLSVSYLGRNHRKTQNGMEPIFLYLRKWQPLCRYDPYTGTYCVLLCTVSTGAEQWSIILFTFVIRTHRPKESTNFDNNKKLYCLSYENILTSVLGSLLAFARYLRGATDFWVHPLLTLIHMIRAYFQWRRQSNANFQRGTRIF